MGSSAANCISLAQALSMPFALIVFGGPGASFSRGITAKFDDAIANTFVQWIRRPFSGLITAIQREELAPGSASSLWNTELIQ